MQRAYNGFHTLYGDEHDEVRELKDEWKKLLVTSDLYHESKAKVAMLEESKTCSETELLLAIKHPGSVLADQTRFEEATVQLERAHQGLVNLDPTGEKAMDCFWYLSYTYLNTRNYLKEADLCQHTLAKLESKLGPDHTETLRVVGELSRCLAFQGHDGEAIKCMQRVVAGYEKTKGTAHEMTRRYSNELSTLLERRCRIFCDYCFGYIENHSFLYQCKLRTCTSSTVGVCEECFGNGVSCSMYYAHIMTKRSAHEVLMEVDQTIDDTVAA
jgi:hypothetical protein